MLISQTDRIYGSATSPLPTGEAVYRQGLPWYVSLTKGRFKYIRYLAAGEGEEWYDLAADPDELKNLIADKQNAALISRFRRELLNELRRTHAPFVDSMP